MQGRICDKYALRLDAVAAPNLVFFKHMTDRLFQNRSMQRADDLDVKTGCFLKKCLHLHSIFSYDIEIIPSRLAVPVLIHIKRTELAETIGAEQHLVAGIIAYHNFRPMYHRCHDERQLMASQFQGIALLDRQRTAGIKIKVQFQHRKCLRIAYQCDFRVPFYDRLNT